jgi:hypothetical protein
VKEAQLQTNEIIKYQYIKQEEGKKLRHVPQSVGMSLTLLIALMLL